VRAACALYSKPRHNVLIIMHIFCRLTVARSCFLLVKSGRWSIRVIHGFVGPGHLYAPFNTGYHMATFDRPPLCAYQHRALTSPYNCVRVLSPYGQQLLRKYKAMPLCCYGESWLYVIQHTSSMCYGGMNVRRSFHRF
jgi:hypothetical protein